MSRKVVASPKSEPLFVLAGLPDPIHRTVRERLEKSGDLPPARYISYAFSKRSPVYSPAAAGELLKTSGAFVVGQRDDGSTMQPAPSRIYLLYVPNPGEDERLLELFDFFAYPIAVGERGLQAWDSAHWRHDLERAYREFERVIRDVWRDSHPAWNVRRVIEAGQETLLRLPPRNFHIDAARRLAHELVAERRNGGDYTGLEGLIEPQKFTHDVLPRALPGKRRGHFFCDHRGIVFPPDPNPHGLARETPVNPKPRQIQVTLNQLYRLGMPLRPGLHHDAQYSAREFEREQFECVERGVIEVSGTHANVYPNDYVREP